MRYIVIVDEVAFVSPASVLRQVEEMLDVVCPRAKIINVKEVHRAEKPDELFMNEHVFKFDSQNLKDVVTPQHLEMCGVYCMN